MPMRLAYPCSHPGCPARAVKDGRCAQHYRTATISYERGRGSSTERGYGGVWRRIRAEHLAIEPACRRCGAPATDVHHLIALDRGGTHAHVNLASLCHACHSALTLREHTR